ncbi:uncharacterized protein LOC113861038 [Abrus precatorius]|uniref:Uncharacterized protein LOC113861038 n=1 Tax=Abrus precatorius TaxID=3816 RepID=A0A8B8L1L6_ABRPR|nr:uncharacterized protein LOC113861038 [Abrus precatorius]
MYELNGLYFVTFTYVGDKVFHITISNANNVEIEYPYSVPSTVNNEIPFVLMWQRTVSKSLESGRNVLCLPIKYVREVMVPGQSHIILKEEHGLVVKSCVVRVVKNMTRTERYLGARWYDFCKTLNLNEGDKISFWHYGVQDEL